jgi:hypothetical protein
VELRSGAAGGKRFLVRGSGEERTHLPNCPPPLTSLIAQVPCSSALSAAHGLQLSTIPQEL